MAKKTQGSALYVLMPILDSNGDPTASREVVKVDCVLNVNTGGNPADQIETTCLEATSRTYIKGLRTPGQSTFNIDADPEKESHHRLYEASESDDEAYDELMFAYGWSDGTAAPTATMDSNGDYDFVLPDTRSFVKFAGYVSDFPFDAQGNSVVKTAVTVQRSGRGHWSRKSA
jgi:hypothetical protein